MEELLEWMELIEDVRQEKKVRHKLKDIIVIVLFATLANVNDWVEMEYFAHYHQEYLRKYIELKNGIPSHDTLCRVMGMITSETLQELYSKWQELVNRGEGEAIKKIIDIELSGLKKRIEDLGYKLELTDKAKEFIKHYWDFQNRAKERVKEEYINFGKEIASLSEEEKNG